MNPFSNILSPICERITNIDNGIYIHKSFICSKKTDPDIIAKITIENDIKNHYNKLHIEILNRNKGLIDDIYVYFKDYQTYNPNNPINYIKNNEVEPFAASSQFEDTIKWHGELTDTMIHDMANDISAYIRLFC